MQTHNRSCLPGPVSGTRQWWRQLEIDNEPMTGSEQEPMFRAAPGGRKSVARSRRERMTRLKNGKSPSTGS